MILAICHPLCYNETEIDFMTIIRGLEYEIFCSF